MLISAFHSTLEYREVVFNSVGVELATDVFALSMVNNVMFGELLPDLLVQSGTVSHELGFTGQVFFHDRHDGLNAYFINNHSLSAFGVTIYQRQDFALLAQVTASAVAFDLAHVSFVNFDQTTTVAEVASGVIFHGLTDAVRHEPSGFESNTQSPVQLIRANALLAGGDQEDRLQPQVHFDVAGLENGSYLHSERLTTLVALVSAYASRFAAHLANALSLFAAWAARAIRPEFGFNKLVSGFFVMKVGFGQDAHDVFPQKMGLLCPSGVGTSSITS